MKVLIVKTSSLGDIVHAFPVLAYLRLKFPNAQIEVIDMTMQGNHFSLTIISDLFNGVSLINRHKLIYREFKNEMSITIHALQIKMFTKLEWQKNKM